MEGPLTQGGGGLPNPTESTTWGPCSLEGGAGQYAPDPRRFQLVRLEGERLAKSSSQLSNLEAESVVKAWSFVFRALGG